MDAYVDGGLESERGFELLCYDRSLLRNCRRWGCSMAIQHSNCRQRSLVSYRLLS